MTIIFYSITYLYKFSRFYQILLHAHSIEWKIQLFPRFMHIKFIYSEKATKFYKIFTLLLSYVVPVKSKVKISQNFVAFSEYINFNTTPLFFIVFSAVFLKKENNAVRVGKRSWNICLFYP